jgi:hypothetical protein
MKWTPHPTLGIEIELLGEVQADCRVKFSADPDTLERPKSVETIRAIPPYKPARAERLVAR